jgi:hypothetical protein
MRVGGARFGLAVLRPPRHQLQKSVRAAEQDRPDVAAARTAWADNQPKLDPNRPVFIDETGTSTKMARSRGSCSTPLWQWNYFKRFNCWFAVH